MSVRFGTIPNLDGIVGPVPIEISVNDEVIGTAPMTPEQLQKFMERLPNPEKIYDSRTIQKFTSRKYILKKAAKYCPLPMLKYVHDFRVRRNRTIIVEPTLLTEFFDGKSRVTIEDLIANKENSVSPENKFFLCRTIRPPWIETAEVKMISTGLEGNVYLVVEDPEGKKTITMNLFNYPRRRMDDIIEEFPVGIVLAVSYPALMHQYMGSIITLNFSNDVYNECIEKNEKFGSLIKPSEEMIRKLYPNGIKWNSAIPTEYEKFVLDIHLAHQITSPDDWKHLGNVHFARKQSEESCIAYGKGLELEPQNIIRLSNRAAAYLQDNKYEQALQDANTVLEMDPNLWLN